MNKAGRSAQNRGVREDCGGKGFLCLDLFGTFCVQACPEQRSESGAKSTKGIGVHYHHQPSSSQ